MIHWLERKIGKFAVANLTLYLLAGQVFFFLAGMIHPDIVSTMMLEPRLVLGGEVWRLVSFLFLPPVLDPNALSFSVNLIFYLFFLYLFWFFGTTLEHHWGTFRFNLFLGVGYLATVAVTFILPGQVATNAFLYGTMFLAFAFLYPDFQLLLFFILPIKIKWLALIQWLAYGYLVITGDWMQRLLVLAGVLNFLLFFARDIAQMIARGRRTMARQRAQAIARDEPFHKCVACGRTDLSDPKLEFRYCNKCAGAPCYCIDHIKTHEHTGQTVAANEASQ